jgi:hypothetical protein
MIGAKEGVMRMVVRLFAGLVGLFVLVMGVQQIAAESGEVVFVTTKDTAGEAQQTRLRVVDRAGQQWLRAGAAQAGWFVRLQANDSIEMERDGTTNSFVAVPDPSVLSEVNELMGLKYGWADVYIGMLFGRDDSIPIGLRPVP